MAQRGVRRGGYGGRDPIGGSQGGGYAGGVTRATCLGVEDIQTAAG